MVQNICENVTCGSGHWWMCVCVPLVLDAVSSSHDPVGSNQRSSTSVPPRTVPLVLQRDLETNKDMVRDAAGCESWEGFC